jgi:hypothetical protein
MTITLESLRSAIGSHLGKELTPEVAVAIEMAATDTADKSFGPEQFVPQSYRGITFQVESFRKIIDELHALHEAHFAETEKHLEGFALKPDYPYLFERERMGTMIQFTARDGAKLAGNLRMYISRSTHTGTLVAEEDTFFLLPEYRKGFAALAFLRWVEQCLVDVIGVREIRANSKVVNKAHRLMDYRGYRHVANQYVKTFQEGEAR